MPRRGPCAIRRLFSLAAAVVLAGALALSLSRSAAADPNAALYYRLLFNFAGKTVNALGESWTFDQNFSRQLVAKYDLNHDGKLSPEESADLGKQLFANLANVRYFTFVTVGGQDVTGLKPFGFKAQLAGKFVSFTFGLALPKPVDPATAKLQVQIKDPDFTIFTVPVKQDPVMLRGAPDTCKADIDQKADPDFGAAAIPPTITLTCRP